MVVIETSDEGIEKARGDSAEGLLAASSRLRFSVSTSDLEEWRPLVRALGGPTDLPFRVDGEAAFNGTLAGTFSAPTLA